jgi:hypothetical protein
VSSIALLGGAAFFIWLLVQVGTGPIVGLFRESGGWIAGIILLYGLFQCSYCFGWSLTLKRHVVRFRRLLGIYLAGDATNYVFPMSGEAMRVALLRPNVPTVEGMYSVSVTKFCEALAHLLFYIVGLTLALFAFPLPDRVRYLGVGFSAGLMVGLTILFRLQRKGLYGPVLDIVEKIVRKEFSEQTRASVSEVDRLISNFYAEHPRKFVAIVFFKLVGKMGGAVEAALVLMVLGYKPTITTAFAIETLSLLVGDLFFFIPGRVGGAEGGRTAVWMMLGYTKGDGFSYALIRRARELFWNGVGLTYLLVRRAGKDGRAKAVLGAGAS